MNNIRHVFQKFLPFLMTIFLWRLSTHWWNPAGILALIPIFYYTFVKPVSWFVLFGSIFCFLIDYRCGLPLFWTSLFVLLYAINGFQNYIDVQHLDNNAVFLFMLFIGVGIFILTLAGFTLAGLINNLWLFVWLSILYIPITDINKWVKND